MEIDQVASESKNQHQIECEEDLYLKMKQLERELELLSMQEDYLRDEQRHLKSEYIRSKEEIKRIQAVYLETNNFVEMVDENYGIIGSANSGKYVRVYPL